MSIVVVIGANGFLGQHVVHLLQTKYDKCRLIRCFDETKFTNKLNYKESKPMESIVGTICNLDEITKGVEGADIVFHLASVISYGTMPDFQKMDKVNINGTINVIEACIKGGVSKLIYTSSINAVLHDDPKGILEGDESLPIPNKRRFLFPGYGNTKSAAEQLVLKASFNNNDDDKNGGNNNLLRTISLRLATIYGEGDENFLPKAIRPIFGHYIVEPKLSNSMKNDNVYVGNAAWAHLVAADALERNDDGTGTGTVCGQAFFVLDDTPPCNCNEFFRRFIRHTSYEIFPIQIPLIILTLIAYLTHVISVILLPFWRLNLHPSLNMIKYVSSTITFTDKKARMILNYQPLYSFQESIDRSMSYYKKFF